MNKKKSTNSNNLLKVPGYITSPSEAGYVCTYSMLGKACWVFSLSGTTHISLYMVFYLLEEKQVEWDYQGSMCGNVCCLVNMFCYI